FTPRRFQKNETDTNDTIAPKEEKVYIYIKKKEYPPEQRQQQCRVYSKAIPKE
ncbi:3866_t:CDS:1, partial [Gigaspora rosea]